MSSLSRGDVGADRRGESGKVSPHCPPSGVPGARRREWPASSVSGQSGSDSSRVRTERCERAENIVGEVRTGPGHEGVSRSSENRQQDRLSNDTHSLTDFPPFLWEGG